jgi:hypothetical protein
MLAAHFIENHIEQMFLNMYAVDACCQLRELHICKSNIRHTSFGDYCIHLLEPPSPKSVLALA